MFSVSNYTLKKMFPDPDPLQVQEPDPDYGSTILPKHYRDGTKRNSSVSGLPAKISQIPLKVMYMDPFPTPEPGSATLQPTG